jgi:hypothetical protein
MTWCEHGFCLDTIKQVNPLAIVDQRDVFWRLQDKGVIDIPGKVPFIVQQFHLTGFVGENCH